MKSWFITGASSGIGRSVAERLLERGDRVAATARRTDAFDELGRAYGDRLRPITLDLADAAAIRREVDSAFADFGRIDVVFGNAGYGLFGAAEEVTDYQVERQIGINLTGSINFIRACLPHLRAQAGGRILQTSSSGGQAVYPGFSIYHAAKWGIEGFVETTAAEVASFGIDAVIVEPGPTRTRFAAGVDVSLAIDAYATTPVGEFRRAIETNSVPTEGDPSRYAGAIIAAADADRPPSRLVLGKSAFTDIERTLAERLEMVRGQRDAAIAASSDEG